MKPLAVCEYDPGWPDAFARLAAVFEKGLSGIAYRIEHVGSTSVPGLAAKPIIDIDIIVSMASLPHSIRALELIGYRHRGDLGIKDREAFFPPDGIDIEHHLYVCIEGALALRNHLVFRDWLKTHSEDRALYGDLKMNLAKRFPHDIDSFIAGKTEFIVFILSRCGLGDAELGDIRNVNQHPKA
jgi:GrpB-like predicted nucleotidyltransferase (UPF0157 family)